MKTKKTWKKWTPEEEQFVLDLFGSTTIQYMMDRLNRSSNSIVLKYQELTGSRDAQATGGFVSPPIVAEALGVSHRTITLWIKQHKLPAKRLHQQRKISKSYCYSLDPAAVWKWVAKNKERVNFSQVKKGVLLPEPRWLEKEIQNATYVKPPRNWTKEEDNIAWTLYKSGLGYREIAKHLNRPEKGTQRRLTTILKKLRENATI